MKFMETYLNFFKIDNVVLAYAVGFYHLIVRDPMGDRKLPLTVISEAEATLQSYGRGLGETLFVQPDGSLLHTGWVFEKNQ